MMRRAIARNAAYASGDRDKKRKSTFAGVPENWVSMQTDDLGTPIRVWKATIEECEAEIAYLKTMQEKRGDTWMTIKERDEHRRGQLRGAAASRKR